MIARGSLASIPCSAALRAARASTKSVSAKVRTGGEGSALTISTPAPARAIAPVSSAAAVRQPAVLPADTTSTSVPGTSSGSRANPAALTGRAVERHQVGAEPGGADELDRLEARTPDDVEAGSDA